MTDTATLAARLEKLEERQREQDALQKKLMAQLKDRDAMADILARQFVAKETFVCKILVIYREARDKARAGALGLRAKMLSDDMVMNRLQSRTSYGGGWDLRDMAIDVENFIEALESEPDGARLQQTMVHMGVHGFDRRETAEKLHVSKKDVTLYWQRGILLLWEWLGDYDPERN